MREERRRIRFTYQRKLLLTFLLLALVPTLVLLATQMRRLDQTIDFWQNPGVDRSLRESLALAESALAAEEKKAAELVASFRSELDRMDADRLRGEAGWEALRPAAERSGLDLLRIELCADAGRGPAEVVLDFRKPGIEGSLSPPGSTATPPSPPETAAARDSILLAGGDILRITGGVLLPGEIRERVGAVRDGFAFYGRLRVYERYAKTKAAGEGALILAAAGILAFFVARALSRSLSRPIGALVEGTRLVQRGDLDHRIRSDSSDEIGTLVDSFNEMTRELKESREKLVRAERVATWAEAARRIAHEIKNPLTPITLSLHRLAKRAETLPDAERRALDDLLEPMIEEVENLRSLADAFSQFSRLPSPKMEPVDIGDLLEKVASLYREGTDVAVTVAVDPGTPAVHGDRELLWRAFSNLVKNAVEAMEGAGALTLRAGPRGNAVDVLVSDTGPGIDAGMRERIFAPTFTTKPGGSGLGLALVERILHEHGGSIAVEPNAPKGTTFRVRLPATG